MKCCSSDPIQKTNYLQLYIFYLTGAGCGDWTDAESAQTLRPCTNMDVSKIKGEEGDINTCKRCVGKVKNSFWASLLKKEHLSRFIEVVWKKLWSWLF